MEENIPEAHLLFLSYDPELKEFLRGLLKGEGYELDEAESEKSFFQTVKDRNKDLLLIDFEPIQTLDICKKIRSNFTLRHIPIILLVEHDHTIEKIKGIYAGADDYVGKPIQAGDLLTRIKSNLWRAKRDLDANPLTKLPGNVSILRDMEKRIKKNENFCIAYADLNKFKEYNDYYGFDWGDKIIKHTAEILAQTLMGLDSANNFLGHIGGDDFLFTTGPDYIEDICKTIIEKFDKTISIFYKTEDLHRGFIIVKNRTGKICSIPIMSIAIGVASSKNCQFTHVGKAIQVVSELKNFAKMDPKSAYVLDQRNL